MEKQAQSKSTSTLTGRTRQWLARAALASTGLLFLEAIPVAAGICLFLAAAGSAEAQRPASQLPGSQEPGYIYVADGQNISVDVLRASDHIQIAAMPTILVPFGVAAARDGKRVYVSTFDGKNIYTFDAETSTVVSTLQFGSELREIALTPDDKYLYVPDYNENVVHVVSTRDNTLMGDIPVGANPHMVAFGDHGKYAYVTNEAGGSVTAIDTRTTTVVSTIAVGQTPIGIAASPDSETIYVASYSANEISVLSAKTQKIMRTVSLPGSPKSVAVSPDGKFVYAICENPNSGYAISIESGSIVSTFPVGSDPRNVTVSPDGKTVYVTNHGSQDLYAINAATYQLDYKKFIGYLDGIALSESAKPEIKRYRFETIDYPGAVETEVAQVNDKGEAVGWYIDQSQVTHGFLHHGRQFTSYDFPGSLGTRLLGINSGGQAVGSYTTPQGYTNGFKLQDGVGSIVYVQAQDGAATLSIPAAVVEAIDDEGSMVGEFYAPPYYNNDTFRIDGTSQQNFYYPGSNYTQTGGVTKDLVSGWFGDSEEHNHIFILRGSEYSEFDFPGGGPAPDGSFGYNLAYKVNDRGDVAGFWGNAYSVDHGFLIEADQRRSLSFDYPDAFSTINYGINNAGQVTGSYEDTTTYATHGFIATPKECSGEEKQ